MKKVNKPNTKNYLVALFVLVILLIGTSMSTAKKVATDPFIGPPTFIQVFEEQHQEVREFWKEQTGEYPDTPIQDFVMGAAGPGEGVLAYCWLEPGKEYIAWNYDLIESVAAGNKDFLFQVAIHEYSHCQGRIGHIEMYGHFMNNGGHPELTKDEVKEQFIDYAKYYNEFYRKLFAKPEDDLNALYALTIETDANGQVKITCPCKACAGLR